MALDNPNYDQMDSILEDIHNESIRMDKNEKALLNQRFHIVLSRMIEELRKDEQSRFKQVYNRVGFTGSFYDGVRVAEATEFDLNLILKPKIRMEITKERCKPGFIAIKMDDSDEWFSKNWGSNGYLSPEKVKRWLQSLVWKTLQNCGNKIENCTIRSSKSGPAITLTVISEVHPRKEISIDFVPVLEFPSSQWPKIDRKSKKILNGTFEDCWFAVPKHPEFWRLSFPRQEQYIMKDLYYLKYTLRLMKKVRDDLNMGQIASYYVKTLFLLEVEKLGRDVWSKTKGRLFMHMLIKFQEALESRNIPFYWDTKCNLIDWIGQDYLRGCAGRLKNFIKKIDQLVLLDNKVEINRYLRQQLNSHGFVMVDTPRRSGPALPVVDTPRRSGTSPPVAEQVEAASSCTLQ